MTIDWWTLGFQAVNVTVLVWLLQHFFWRPVAAMIELRRSTTEKALADAKAAQAEATAAQGCRGGHPRRIRWGARRDPGRGAYRG